MTSQIFNPRRVAVLGAGVMGAQIAAHLVNAGIPALLFELPAAGEDADANARRAIAGLAKLEPSPIATRSVPDGIVPANYDQHLPLLAECDLVIEAISERLDWKKALYEKVAPHLGPDTVFASNTSGLSINALAQACPESMRSRFCGVHFFNPPRYMTLVELIPCRESDPAMLDRLEAFLVSALGKGVVRAHDTPNFIANRVGVFAMLAAMHHARRLDLGFDVVDALTGPRIGRPKSATFRTADVVGLDTLAHVINTMRDQLPDDPWHRHYAAPDWMQALIAKGALGQKTRAGVYRKVGKDIQVLDLAQGDYRPSAGAVDAETDALLKERNPARRLAGLRAAASPQAQFLWAVTRDVLHYSAVHLATIADNARDLDLAIRWGFGWDAGPLESWQAAGWGVTAEAIARDISDGRAMAEVPLPAWVGESGRQGVHGPDGSWSAAAGAVQPRSTLPVYCRQLFPDTVLGERAVSGTTVFETDAVRMWHSGDDVAVVSLRTKMHAIGDDVLDGVQRALAEAARGFRGLVLWQDRAPFSVGANLAQHGPALMAGNFARIEESVANFQRTSLALRYSTVPVVAAVQGMALGGGCEFLMHCARAVVAFESYIGLVEAGVGLVPGGGGCKEFALRAVEAAQGADPLPWLQRAFQTIAMATVGTSAPHARELGFLRPTDVIIMNPRELLHVAKAQVKAMSESAWRAPLPARAIPVAGRGALGTLEMMLANMRAGGFISGHDERIAQRIALALCGGDLDPGTLVDEAWLLRLERDALIDLLRTPETQARIQHMLATGKPLRN